MPGCNRVKLPPPDQLQDFPENPASPLPIIPIMMPGGLLRALQEVSNRSQEVGAIPRSPGVKVNVQWMKRKDFCPRG